ncbi:MAG: LysR family transcriptional regulator [Litorimonas sp.]
MDMLKAMKVSLGVADQGGFASAARTLGMSPPSVTRIVSELEADLGVALFRRSTRSVETTEAGDRFFSVARRTLEEVGTARAAAREDADTPRGLLRVTAPVLFGRLHVMPVVRDFLDRHPGVRADVTLTDRQTSLIEDGQDVAIRIGHLPDSSLKAARVGHVGWTVCAAPSYLAQTPPPLDPDALAGHRTIAFLGRSDATRWTFAEDREVMVAPHLRCSTMEACIDSAVAGWGLTRALSYQVRDLIADGRLTQLLGAYEKPPLPVHVIHSERSFVTARTRLFLDDLIETLRASPALDP